MNPLFLTLLGTLVLAGLAVYALYRAATPDVPAVLATAARTLPVLVLGAVALVLVDPADIPSVLRAVMPK
ncbi:hypothetical protein ABZY57_04520 [Streptomyces sp. NPDC006450]|uniref:hypothetical protein n=1 Tax=Streptomyces sp. NPDC006450 TaxID=3155458 RepID=UPI0033B71D85